MANWTAAQLQAITTSNKTLLISAAAGSGKTTVLIERIIRSLTDPECPADISRMLIVTFTRAAASELRGRISAALSNAIAERPDDKHLFRQLTLLGSAHISTIDSFYADIVRRNASRLDIPSSLRIADDSELLPLKHSVMDKAIDEGYGGELSFDGDEFAELTETLYDMRNDTSLAEVFTDLYEKLSSHPKFIEFLAQSAEFYDTAAESDFFDSPIGGVLKDHILSQLDYSEAMLEAVCRYFSEGAFADGSLLPPFVADLEYCRNAKATVKNGGFEAARDAICSYTAMRRGKISAEDKTPETEYYLSLRESFKAKLAKLKKSYFSAPLSSDDMRAYAAETAKRIRMLHVLLKRFDSLYAEEKATRGICEFNDIKLWAYKLLVSPDGSPTDLAGEIADGFDAVYIDEYQDVDLIQDLIFRAVSKPRTRFMVGDIKQSIYGFRGAEPSLFMNYRESFPSLNSAPDADECTVFMSENFRCDNSIIKFANTVCSYVFKVGGKEISYTDGDDLRFSKKCPEDYRGTPVKVALIDTKKYDDEGERHEGDLEARYIAREIIRLTSGEKKADGTPITFGDIAVLYRSSTFGAKVAEILDLYRIPHTYGSSSSIFDCPEVALTLSILNVTDNPLRDVHLAAALISPIFGLDPQSLLDIKSTSEAGVRETLYAALCRCADSDAGELAERCKKIISEIDGLRTMSASLPTDKIIRFIYSKYSLLSRGDESTRSALKALYENARSYEGDSFKGLYSYLKYIDDMIASENTVSSETSCGADSVNLMSIHKSKGLEFPVCFVSGCAGSFNRDDAKDLLLYSQTLGLAMDLGDESGFGRIRTPFRSALSREIYDRSSEEEMRVLYVALTRARERLYVTAALRFGAEHELEKARTCRTVGTPASILDSNSYISWVLTAIWGLESELFETEVIMANELSDTSDETQRDSENESEPAAPAFTDGELRRAREHIEKIFTYRYPHLHVSNLPAKLSVSRLSPDVLDRSTDTVEEADAILDISLPELKHSPLFMGEDDKVSAAQKGTDTHTFMQFCDFGRVEAHGVKNELDRLIHDGFIEKRAAATVNLRQVGRFFESTLFKELKRARSVLREQRFNILLPAGRFTADPEYAAELENEELLVQGVIDLVFETENGELVLCDYKTDYLTPAELDDRALAEKKLCDAHRRQLSYYAAAVKRIFGKAPDRVIIYSLPLGDSVVILPESVE